MAAKQQKESIKRIHYRGPDNPTGEMRPITTDSPGWLVFLQVAFLVFVLLGTIWMVVS